MRERHSDHVLPDRRCRLDVRPARLRVWAVLGALCLVRVAFAGVEPSPDERFLDGLKGEWVMEGQLRDQPVRYLATGDRVLAGGFVRLHMVDIGQPPKYRADVFIGYDPKAGDYIAHWLDQFGAAGARVVASGKRVDNRLVILFPYAEGAFRDTFTWDAAADSWTLLIESQATAGAWATFARYALRRPSAAATGATAVDKQGKSPGGAMEKVTGIGGVFFRGTDPKALTRWYEEHLGVTSQVWQQAAGPTAFQPFARDTDYFGDASKQWMLNFRVENLDALVAQLRAAGIEVKVDPTAYPYGRFARTHDPDGNPIELWEPKPPGGAK